ncbi:PEP/pyruvate-binding domain-containing protein [Arthrobacter sp. UYEF21]|uniref:PEP/pyruvate-binding domain-containing protein n=1 Tax=Arthrobacter sp. UYEF21 TaxID=1756364 RepID=UPI003398DA8D
MQQVASEQQTGPVTVVGDDILLPPLGSPAALRRESAGSKAAALSSLLAAGFPVPAGFVVTQAAFAALSAQSSAVAAKRLQGAALAAGPGPYAVRSSAAAEDLPGASFAGMYESYLSVAPPDLPAAVQRCFDSANAGRIRAYESSIMPGSGGHPAGDEGAVMAVLVQQMVDPAAAGVAFSANPLTGDRAETVISAVPGLAEGLVSGVATGEEWIAGAGGPILAGGAAGVLSVESATAVATGAARVARHFGCPQDIEWAVDRAGNLQILQARPMTAVPDPVSWQPPGKGAWLRNFRLGEWLPEPVTPLFMDWVIPRIDAAYNEAVRRSVGIDVPMENTAVNGWYYVSPPTPRQLPRLLLSGHRQSLPYFFNAVVRPMFDPAGADRTVLRSLEHEWRTECLPAYRQLVDTPPLAAATATVPELMDVVDKPGKPGSISGSSRPQAAPRGSWSWPWPGFGAGTWPVRSRLSQHRVPTKPWATRPSWAACPPPCLSKLPMPCTALTGTTRRRANSFHRTSRVPDPKYGKRPNWLPLNGEGLPRLRAVPY